MKKNSVLQSLSIRKISFKILNKKECAEMFFPRIALLCHSEAFSEKNNGKGYYLTGNNWGEIYDLFLKYYVSEFG